MYRVLVADDEIHICQLISHLIDWEGLSLELCCVVHDGVNALAQIQALQPHIVVSDIRMSGMDGISLLEKTREAGLDCAFILVSGYRQFEYAQRAIQLGVTDYIVKPIKKKELNDALAKAVAALDAESSLLEERQAQQLRREQSVRKDLENLTGTIEANASKLGELTPGALAEQYGLQLLGRQRILFAKLVCAEPYTEETRALLLDKLEACIREDNGLEAGVCARWGRGILLVGATQGQPPSLSLLQKRCQAVISVFANWKVILGGCEPLPEESFFDAAHRAEEAAQRHYFFPTEEVFFAEGQAPSAVRFQDRVGDRASLVETMQILKVREVCDRVRADMGALEQTGCAQAVFDYAGWVVDAMNHALTTVNMNRPAAQETPCLQRAGVLEELYHCQSLQSVTSRLCLRLEQQLEQARGAIEQMEDKPIRVVREMVERRYMEQISLADAAEATGLTPVYLSILFKKETGTNFKDYLTAVRIGKAKELLRKGESITLVSEQVGYKDSKYFSQLFARQVGINPAQYKKLYL